MTGDSTAQMNGRMLALFAIQTWIIQPEPPARVMGSHLTQQDLWESKLICASVLLLYNLVLVSYFL